MRTRKVDKRRWYFAGLNVLLVLLAAVCAVIFGWMTGLLPSLDAAQRWRGGSETAFTQVACFLPVDEPRSKDQILQFRRTLDAKLTDASLEAPENGSLYADAYSAEAKLTVTGDHGSAQVRTVGVGGQFFLFHPLTLRSGSYISEHDLMQDRVVLDETTAWTLFGSPDVAGMSVTIEGKPYYVAGVIHREDDFASEAAYGEGAGMFLSYDAFYELTQREISCYEIVLPNMISGFGLGLVKDNFDVGSGDIVENTTRFGLKHLLSVIGAFGERSMRHNGVIYPYWENAVRMTEDWLALLLLLMLLLLACPVIALTIAVISALVKTGKYLEVKIPETAENLVEKRRRKKWKAK